VKSEDPLRRLVAVEHVFAACAGVCSFGPVSYQEEDYKAANGWQLVDTQMHSADELPSRQHHLESHHVNRAHTCRPDRPRHHRPRGSVYHQRHPTLSSCRLDTSAVVLCSSLLATSYFLCFRYPTMLAKTFCFPLSVHRVCPFVCLFVQTDLVTMISHERLEQSH